MKNTFRAPPIALQLGEPGAPPSKIQVARVGTFHHPKYGQFEISKETLASMKKNFDEKVRGIDIALDYKHASEDIAAAWFTSLELNEDGTELWGVVDWTPKGSKVVGEKEFRYVSADFHFDYKDNESLKKFGPTLLGAGLTNRPVIKGQSPVVELSEFPNEKETEVDKDQMIAELKAKIAELEKQLEMKAGEQKKMGDMEKQMGDMQKQLSEANEKLAKAEADNKDQEKKAAFDLKLSEGSVVEAQRDAFMKGDMDAFLKLAQPVKLSEVGNGKPGDKPAQKKAEDEALELAEKAVTEKRAPDLGAAVSLVLSENEELKKRYLAEQAQ